MVATHVHEPVDRDSATPWLGPDAYTEDQHPIFFGREQEAAELLRLVEREALTVLFSASGLGKSSLLQAGLIPALRQRDYLPVSIRFDHGMDAPTLESQLLRAIADAAHAAGAEAPDPGHAQSLWEYFHRDGNLCWNKRHRVLTPVLIIDQFEELFTLGQQNTVASVRSDQLLQSLADLVENLPPVAVRRLLEEHRVDLVQAGFGLDGAPFKVLISLREDYLAFLEPIRKSMPSLHRNRMRITPMTRSQARRVIEEPARPFDLLDDGAADTILAIVSRAASSPGQGAAGRRGPSVGSDLQLGTVDPALLSIFCYELNERRREQRRNDPITNDLLSTTKERILSGFYSRAFAGLSRETREFVEEELVSPAGFRDSRALDSAKEHLGPREQELEVLVRRRLLRYEDRGTGLRRIELTHDVLLDAAMESRIARRSVAHRARRRNARIRRMIALLFVGMPLVAFLAFVAHRFFYVWEDTALYADFAVREGQPFGVGQLTSAQAARRPVSFRIVRSGRRGPVKRMEAIDAEGRLTPLHERPTYFHYAHEAADAYRGREVRWEYEYDSQGRLLYQRAIDGEDQTAWTFLYSPADDDVPTERRGFYVMREGVTAKGTSGQVKMRYEADTGWETEIGYLSPTRSPKPGLDEAFGRGRTFDKLGHLLKEVSLDAHGWPMNDSAGNAALVLTYQGDFSIEEKAIDAEERATHVTDGWSSVQYQRDDVGNIVREAYFGTNGKATRTKRGYHLTFHSLDGRGDVERTVYLDEDLTPTHDDQGCFALAFRRTRRPDRSMDVDITCLSETYLPGANANGHATRRLQFDARHDLESEAYFDHEMRPTSDEQGVHRVILSRDDLGREIERKYLGVHEEPVVVAAGYVSVKNEYDPAGNEWRVTFFGADGGFATHEDGYSQVVSTYDSEGRKREEYYLHGENEPAMHKDGHWGKRFSYDDFGRVAETCYLGPDRRIKARPDGFACERYVNDALGRRLETQLLDEDGELTLAASGVAGWTSEFDAWSNEIRRSYFDPKRRDAVHLDGYAHYEAAYDERGNQLRIEYFGLTKSRTAVDGCAGWIAEYDDWGREKAVRCVDAEGNPSLHADGYSTYLRTYSRTGDLNKEEYFDRAGLLVTIASSPARVEMRYDGKGRLLAEESYDAYGQPTEGGQGYHRVTYELNAHGQRVRTCFFNRFSKPARVRGGYHCVLREFDSVGRKTREGYVDRNGGATRNTSGYAHEKVEYDARGNVVARRTFDEKGAPVERKGGAHLERYLLDAAGRVVVTSFFGVAGEPVAVFGVHSTQFEYDEFGNEASRRHFAVNGQPTRHRNGYSAMQFDYDKSGALSEERYLDERENAMVVKRLGFARKTISRRPLADGRVETVDYYDAARAPVLVDVEDEHAELMNTHSEKTYARRIAEYDARGRMIGVAYQDAKHRPRKQKDGCARRTYRYDEQGRPLEMRCFDAENRPTVSIDGAHLVTARFQNDVMIERSYSGVDGRPVVNRDGYSKWVNTVEEGRIVREEARDADDRITGTRLGYAVREFEYDAHGNLVREEVRGEKGERGVSHRLCRKVETEYDPELGLPVEQRCYGTGVKPQVTRWTLDPTGRVVAKRVQARQLDIETRFEYDAFGRTIRETYYDARGKPSLGLAPDGRVCGYWTAEYGDDDTVLRKTCHRRSYAARQ